VPPDIQALVDAADRAPADRALDATRRPAQLLAFAGVRPGMRVAELGAGGGYTAELLARAVGPRGVVYGQNTALVLERFAERPWRTRLAKPVMRNVVPVSREFDDPLPPGVRDLDAVFMVLFLHDVFWMDVDRPRMYRAVLRALRPGGVFVIVDHAARVGTGDADVRTLHRIEERVVRDELVQVGFHLVGTADFLRCPDDARDWSAAAPAAEGREQPSDRFALKFQKPAAPHRRPNAAPAAHRPHPATPP
jgi:predicted methyltransferase